MSNYNKMQKAIQRAQTMLSQGNGKSVEVGVPTVLLFDDAIPPLLEDFEDECRCYGIVLRETTSEDGLIMSYKLSLTEE
jgi:hypothetical protein